MDSDDSVCNFDYFLVNCYPRACFLGKRKGLVAIKIYNSVINFIYARQRGGENFDADGGQACSF